MWCLMGDFNGIVDMSDKRGGCQNTTCMNNFFNFLNKGNLLSPNASGVPFTWCNDHFDNSRIYESLNHGIANSYWLNEYPDYNLHSYPIFGSYHRPIGILSSNPKSHIGILSSSGRFRMST